MIAVRVRVVGLIGLIGLMGGPRGLELGNGTTVPYLPTNVRGSWCFLIVPPQNWHLAKYYAIKFTELKLDLGSSSRHARVGHKKLTKHKPRLKSGAKN